MPVCLSSSGHGGRTVRYALCDPKTRGKKPSTRSALGAGLLCLRCAFWMCSEVSFVAEKGNNLMSHGVGGDAPANVQKYLKGVDYPAKKQELVETAKKNGAPQEVVQVIQQFPNKEFGGPQDVIKAYGDMR